MHFQDCQIALQKDCTGELTQEVWLFFNEKFLHQTLPFNPPFAFIGLTHLFQTLVS